ncbi:MAG: glycosyltransferase [Proteobacteria bacterium]|nr:glycosyltransferase [Pseudomonadota bacterium]
MLTPKVGSKTLGPGPRSAAGVGRIEGADNDCGGADGTWLVVPCYNEYDRLPADVLGAFLDRCPGPGLCLVNDGSTDGTAGLLRGLAERYPGRTVLVDYAENAGKAEAVRRGVQRVLSRDAVEWIGYWDADLSASLDELPRFFRFLEDSPRAEVLTGCRLRRMGSRIDRRLWRHLLGRFFATLASLLLDMPYYDTQCGAKLFRAGLARDVFRDRFLAVWCFDVEIMARIIASRGHDEALAIIVEVPLLSWVDRSGSRLNLAGMARALWELPVIFHRYRPDRRPVE